MLREYVLGYSQNIDALRDFVDSIKLLLDEYASQAMTTSEPAFLSRIQKLQDVLARIPPEERLGILKKTPEEIKQDPRIGEDIDFEFTFHSRENAGGETNHNIVIAISGEEASEHTRQLFIKTERQKELLYKSSLITLTSTSEWFFSELLQFYFEKFPEAVGADTKTFSLNDLKSLGSIEDATKHLIEAKVGSILRESFANWLDFLKKEVKLPMDDIEKYKEDLVEVYQRRNLLVHNGGRVNSIYLSKVSPKFTSKVSKGNAIKVRPKYLNKAIDLFELTFTLVAAELWKKLDKTSEERPRTINEIAFSHLLNERWTVAEGLSSFMKDDAKTPEKSKLNGRINYWQSVKWQGRFDEIRGEVEQADFTAIDELFQLARYALLDNYDEFY